MRKFCSVLTSIVFALLFTTCKPYTADIDAYLSYWSAETYITDSTTRAVVQNDVSSIPSVPSANDVSVTLKLNNPKSFPLDLPPKADAAKNVIVFEHLEQAPAIDTDYTLIQSEDRQSLILTYKASFLQAHEWGEQDLSSTLTLYATDGRKFKQTYTFKVKANTPPPTPGFTVAKTTGTPAYYVLCITVPAQNMKETVQDSRLLHKDITRIEVNGTQYPFSVNEAENRFIKPESDLFIAYSDVEKLGEPDADTVPSGGWVLYYKTDVEVKDGAAKKDYTVRLADAKGLVSGILNASTKPNKAESEKVEITKGNISGSGSGSEADPVIIVCDSTGAELKVSSITAGVTVHGTLTDTGTAESTQYNGNPITVPLPLNGAGEKTYKLEYYTDGEGFATTDVKTVYYKVVEGHTVTFDANTGAYPDGSTAVSQHVPHGSTVTTPDPLPKKEGHYLPGWYKDQACSAGQEWNFTADTVTSDITLYAKWVSGTGPKYTVTFSVDGGNGKIKADSGSFVENGTIEVGHGGSVTFTADPGTGYAVAGWTGVTVTPSYSETATLSNITAGATVTVKFFENTISGDDNPNEAWKKLRKAVNEAPVGGTIFINGTIQATNNGSGDNANYGEITIGKNLTIKKADSAASAVIDANTTIGGKPTHRIFKVTSGTLTLNDLTLTGGMAEGTDLADKDGGAICSLGTLTMTNCTITNCQAENTGGAIYSSGTLKMTGCTIGGEQYYDGTESGKTKGNTAKTGGGVYSGGDITINGGALTYNKATDNSSTATGGGALFVIAMGKQVTVNMTGTEISHNTAEMIGGGIYFTALGIARITGTLANLTVKENELTNTDSNSADMPYGGAGMFFASTSTGGQSELTVDGGTIQNNNARNFNGGGIYIKAGANDTLTLKNGVHILKNEAENGGGIAVRGSIAVIEGAVIGGSSSTDGNKAKIGGAVYAKGALSSVRMKSGSIKGNTATTAGGVAVYEGGRVTLSGGEITGNNATGNGGGVYAGLDGMLTLSNNGTINGNTALRGGGVYVDRRGTLNINGGSITSNQATKSGSEVGNGNGGGVYVFGNSTNKGKVSMTAGEISGNTAGLDGGVYKGDGGGVYNEGGIFTMSGGDIKGNSAKNGGGIYVKGTGATLTMSDGKISANKAIEENASSGGNGGGIVIDKYAKLTISGGTVGGEQYHDGTDPNKAKGNTARVGGGIYLMQSSEKAEIKGGSIAYNKADVLGGGIALMEGGAQAEMTGGSITYNKVRRNGGGVYIGDNNSTPRSLFTLKNGTISYNEASDGGGVCASGDFTMDDGIIEENKAIVDAGSNTGRGGGVAIIAATMNMKGGVIRNNKAKEGGGGVQLGLSGAHDAVLNMSGGTISGNTIRNPSGTGKGVEFFTQATIHGGTYYTKMKMSGSATVDENNDVYVNESRRIIVEGPLTPAGETAAIITPKTYVAGRQTLEGTAALVSSEHTKFKVTPKDLGGGNKQEWEVGSDGKLSEVVTITGTASERWKNLKAAVDTIADGGTIIIKGDIKATNNTGNNGQIVIAKNISIKAPNSEQPIVLDANSNAPGMNAYRIFKVESGKTLTLENLALIGGMAAGTTDETGSGGAIFVNGGTVKITKCTLMGNTANRNGGGVYVGENGTFKMYDSTIIDNAATANGKGVYVKGGDGTPAKVDATFIMGGAACVGQWNGGLQTDSSDVYLDKNLGSANLVNIKIDKDKPITQPKAARITPAHYATDETVLIMWDDLNSSASTAVGAYNDKFTVTPESGQQWEVAGDGKLKKKS